jgi:hypothetical protein
LSKKEIVSNDNSKGYIPDYSGVSSFSPKGFLKEVQGKVPEFSIKLALNVIKNDPVVKGAITTIVDKVMESGWRIQGRDKRSRQKTLEIKLSDLRFNKALRKYVFNLVLYNNAFMEIVKKGEDVTDLNVLEASLMEIKAKDNGDIVSYEQSIGNASPSWKPDKIVHSQLRSITNNVWAEPLDLQALYETVLLKDYIRQYLMWFFGSNQLRGVFAFKTGVAEKSIKDFMGMLKASEKDKTLPLVLQGDLIYEFLNNFDSGDKILSVLDWCDNQILTLLQAPPIAVGKADNSGRSNSVEQYQALNTTVHAIHQILEEDFSYDLFPKIGFGKNDFKFGVLDQTVRMKTLEMVEKMVNMRFTDDAIVEFMDAMDLTFETKEIFKEDPIKLGLSNKDVGMGNEGQLGNAPQDDAPSRKGQDKTQMQKKNQREMVRNSKDKYNKYPYTYEVAK